MQVVFGELLLKIEKVDVLFIPLEKVLRIQCKLCLLVLQGLVHVLYFYDVVISLREDELFDRTSKTLVFEVVDRVVLSGTVFFPERALLIQLGVLFGLHLRRVDIVFVSEADQNIHLIVNLEAHFEIICHTLIIRINDPVIFSGEDRLTKIFGSDICC